MSNGPREDLVRQAIGSGCFTGNVDWKDAAAKRFLDNPRMKGLTPSGLKRMLREVVGSGGQIEPRNEIRDEHRDENHPYWYRVLIPDPREEARGEEIFVEIIIEDFEEADPWVLIVNAHH